MRGTAERDVKQHLLGVHRDRGLKMHLRLEPLVCFFLKKESVLLPDSHDNDTTTQRHALWPPENKTAPPQCAMSPPLEKGWHHQRGYHKPHCVLRHHHLYQRDVGPKVFYIIYFLLTNILGTYFIYSDDDRMPGGDEGRQNKRRLVCVVFKKYHCLLFTNFF